MLVANQVDQCLIWKGHQAFGTRQGWNTIIEESHRAGGGYSITRDAELHIRGGYVDDPAKARLTTILINLRRQGERFPLVTSQLLEIAKVAEPLAVHERAERLLECAVQRTDSIGGDVLITYGGPLELALTESIGKHEARFLAKYLIQEHLIEEIQQHQEYAAGRVTVFGYSHLAQKRSNIDSAQAFVAMWFDPSMKEIYEKGIEPAVREARYNAYRVDRDEYIGRVDDKIIAEIRRSRFLIADFTHGEKGVRGGVYYEAGFAEGLNLPVIPMCKKEKVDGDPTYLHFDTSHLNHILWTDEDDLRDQLQNRILRVIGEGPNLHSG